MSRPIPRGTTDPFEDDRPVLPQPPHQPDHLGPGEAGDAPHVGVRKLSPLPQDGEHPQPDGFGVELDVVVGGGGAAELVGEGSGELVTGPSMASAGPVSSCARSLRRSGMEKLTAE